MADSVRKVPVYCYQCVAGPDLLKVNVEDGIATSIEPNPSAEAVHPGAGRVCVKAFGLVQKTYNPNRLKTPMKRTNPEKGREHDPGFEPIGWDEAFDIVAGKLNEIRAKGLRDEAGYPRVAASFGGGGTPTYYMGTFPAFMAAWGPLDLSFGSGQGVKCYHSEHLYGELWHRAFTVCPDTPTTTYVLSFGANTEASGGVIGVKRHADARVRGLKRVQIEPHLSVSGACSAEWIPIKPKTDAAFMYGLIHVMLHESPREALDLPFLTDRTGSPYLVGPNGYFLREPESRKPLLWDGKTDAAVPFDTAGAEPALEGRFRVAQAVEVGADDEFWEHGEIEAATSFTLLVEHMAPYTPEWAEETADVPAGSVRRIAGEYLAHAQVGETIEIDGRTLPLRPVGVVIGKTVSNGWGGYECCWARTLLACLVGALEVPGGTLGTTVRLNRPATSRQASVVPGPDGFMTYPMNPTDAEGWERQPQVRNGHKSLVPLSANSPWSTALGPTHFAWMFAKESPQNWPEATPPELWFVYRTNPAISFWDTPAVAERIAEFPFTVAFAYTLDETNYMADVLLPECTDLESTQLIRVGGTKFTEAFWDAEGVALRQPAVEPQGDNRDFTDIATELAARTGLLDRYNQAIGKGAAGVPLRGEGYDFSLDPETKYAAEEIWDRVCQAASAELTDGAETQGLDWYREHGFRTRPISRLVWYLYPELEDQGLRFEIPYQEQLLRVGRQLGNRLHEQQINWWDEQLKEYQALPPWKDFPGIWQQATLAAGGDLDAMPFWLLTTRYMQYAWGGNVGIGLMDEMAGNIKGHRGVVINSGKARELGIADGDRVKVYSSLRATEGQAVLRQGIRPDTLLMMGQFDHWVTPYAKDFDAPSLNTITPMALELTDATGSSADIVRVGIERVGA
ncbi:MAG: molybdopterin-dependent oxidoreductase [Alphaproteobacteria bacterium]|nr:molybdopterin-dependent oxidoreductase [Alphaproteobacteria bacterium]